MRPISGYCQVASVSAGAESAWPESARVPESLSVWQHREGFMRLASTSGRAVVLVTDDSGYDVELASGGEFGPGIQALYDRWDSFRHWSAGLDGAAQDRVAVRRDQLGPPA